METGLYNLAVHLPRLADYLEVIFVPALVTEYFPTANYEINLVISGVHCSSMINSVKKFFKKTGTFLVLVTVPAS